MDNDFEGGSGGDHDTDSRGSFIDEVVQDSDGINTPNGSDNQNFAQYLTPIDTIETPETVVASNQGTSVSYVEPPKVGMVFRSWQEVESYYKTYAEQKGFGVTRAQGVYSKGEVRDRIATTWRCEYWGRPDMRAMREAKKRSKAIGVYGTGGAVGGTVCAYELSNCKQKPKKCECKAKVYAGMSREGEWVIRKVELEHSNHTPNPADAKLVKEYRMKKFTTTVRRRLMKYFDKGVPVSQIHGCLASEIEGEDELEYSVKDMAHVVYKARKLKMARGDAAAMMSCFKKMQEGNQHFYHAQRLDQQGRLKDVLWVDARSRAAYEEFGDVVCFDATYLTNEYELPFVNFVGVNHHGQSILLGCALVSHENSDTFAWIFKEWLACMNNRAPGAILTDQAAAMRKPIEDVMPSTRHCWCIWHIMRKIPKKLGKCVGYKDFKGVLKAIVYESLHEEESERRWNDLLVDFNLETNDWLKGLYKERHMWVLAYMRDYFWAGMKTTQRVESINSFFDGFVNSHTKLFEFSIKYAQAMEKRVRDETAADANCGKYVRRKLDENTIQYAVEDRVWVVPDGQCEEIFTDRRRYYSATFNMETNEVSCNCRRFVTHGIMCKHMMSILDQNFVVDIPEKYIVNRWRKDILRKHTKVRVSYHDPNTSVVLKRFNRLMTEFETLCDEAAMINDEAVDVVSKALSSIRVEVENCKILKADECTILSFPDETNTISTVQQTKIEPDQLHDFDSPHLEFCPPDFAGIIQDPLITKKPRGRPKGSRNMTLAEMGFKKPVVRKRNRSLVTYHSENKNGEDTTNGNQKNASSADKASTKGTSKKPTKKGVDTNNSIVNNKRPTKKRVEKATKKGNPNNVNKNPLAKNWVSKGKEVQQGNKLGKGMVGQSKINNNLKTLIKTRKVVPKVKLITELVPLSISNGKTTKKRKQSTGNTSAGLPSKASRVSKAARVSKIVINN